VRGDGVRVGDIGPFLANCVSRLWIGRSWLLKRCARIVRRRRPSDRYAQLHAITVPTWIVDGDHDEAIKRENTEFMAAHIPNGGLLPEPEVHFSFLQDPEQFHVDVLHFLDHVKAR
jgi:pimeloyl-ACP methyl ester carboxylesterase